VVRRPSSHFTSHLKAVAPSAPAEANGDTASAALADVFTHHPAVKGYILDDQGRVCTHIAVFVRRDILDYPLEAESELYVLQALSGG